MEIRRLAPGDRVLDYRILERLGEGGFGEVFRAEHEVLGRIVAIKVPRDASGVAALRHEGVVQARLEHPNIVQTLELSISHDPPYVIMEYVKGSSLAELLRREGPLPWRNAVRVLLEAGRALAFAHSRGVVHGDVKPANLLVEPGRDGRVLLTDFGLGRVFEGPQGNLQISRSLELATSGAEVQGTIRYLAPEVLRGESADERADLYSFGVLLFECVTGRLPEGREVPSDLVSSLPPELDRVFARLFTRKERRPRSFDDTLEALAALQDPPATSTAPAEVVAEAIPGATSAQRRHAPLVTECATTTPATPPATPISDAGSPAWTARLERLRGGVFASWRDGLLSGIRGRMGRPGVAVADGRGFDACFGVTNEGEPHHRVYALVLPELDGSLARATVAEARRIFDQEKGIWEKEVTFWVIARNVVDTDQVLWTLKSFSMGWWRRRRIVLHDVGRDTIYATELGCDPRGNPLKRAFLTASREALRELPDVPTPEPVAACPFRGTAWGAGLILVMTMGLLGSFAAVNAAGRTCGAGPALRGLPCSIRNAPGLDAGAVLEAAVAPQAPGSALDAAVAPQAPGSATDAAVAPQAPGSATDAAVAPQAPGSATDAAVAPQAPGSATDAAVAPQAPGSATDAAVAPQAPGSATDAAVAPQAPGSATDAAVAPQAPGSATDAAVAPQAPGSATDAAVAPQAPGSASDAAVAPQAPGSATDAAVAPQAPGSATDAAVAPQAPGSATDAAVAPQAPGSATDAAVAPQAPGSATDAAVAPQAPGSATDAAVAPQAPGSATDAAVAPQAPGSATDAAVAPQAPGSATDAAVAPQAPGSATDAAVAPQAPGSATDAAVAPQAPGSATDATVAPQAPGSATDAAVAPQAPGSANDAAVAPQAPGSATDAAVAPQAPGSATDAAAARGPLPARRPESFMPHDLTLPRWF